MLIVDILKEAKEFFLKSDKYIGMCECIKWVCKLDLTKYTSLCCIHQNIPEFNSIYLTGKDMPIFQFWWPLCDQQSRIKAFDKLINLYKNSNKEWT